MKKMPLGYEFLESMKIAMEAEDITGGVQDELKKTLSGRASAPKNTTGSGMAGATDDMRGEDIEKVDDIFDLQKPEATSTPGGNTGSPDMQNGGAPDDDSQDPLGASIPVEEPMDENTEVDPTLDVSFAKKNTLRDNMIRLYEVVAGDIHVLENSMNSVETISDAKVLSIVLKHMRNTKQYLYDIITNELTSSSYEDLLQKYIALKNIYEICLEILTKHFNKSEETKNHK